MFVCLAHAVTTQNFYTYCVEIKNCNLMTFGAISAKTKHGMLNDGQFDILC